MKKFFTFLLFFALTKLFGQNYYAIDFTSTGGSIDSIRVENITQNTTVALGGQDILHLLLEPAAINDIEMGSKKLAIFPNPMSQTCNFEFFNAKQGNVSIIVYAIGGKQIYNYSKLLPNGNHTYSLSGVAPGSYIINVQTETDFLTGKLISFNRTLMPTVLKHIQGTISNNSADKSESTVRSSKSNKSIVELVYNMGDDLKFTGYSIGLENAYVFDSPTSDKTYSFVFTQLFVCGLPLTDSRDGNIYRTVQIGGQCWLAENLKFLPIGEEFDAAAGGSLTEPYYYVYNFVKGGNMDTLKNDSAFKNYTTYGILYNWSAAMGWNGVGNPPTQGTQGVCPNGWHLPTHDDWTTLEKNVGSNPDAFPYGGATVGFLGTDEGDAIKDPNSGWCNGTPCGTSGFDALPGGRRYSSGIFYGIGTGARWWSSTEWGAGAWRRYLENVQSGVNRFTDYKTFGFSVRCVKD
ncbi:MAG: FISUMP domain-containing protein [Bacteroidota bacterium]